MKNSLHRHLLASTLLTGLALHAAPAFAQAASPVENATASTGEPADTIVVTGSRIARPDLEAASPVQVLGAVQIQESGATNIQDVLLENPAFGVPALGRTNSAFLTSGTGAATVDLRDLGSDRTLVLINGRRVVAGLPGTATVDLNVIPTQFIERIDVLTGGASAVYGSDAVAGVVNFIYKDDFEGAEVEGQYGITQRGDDAQYQGSLTLGGNFGDDRGNIMVHLGYSNQKGVLSRQRSNTAVDDISAFQFSGDPADYFTSQAPFFSSLPLQGRFTSGGCQFTFNSAGQLQRGFSTNGGPISAGQAALCGVPAGTVLEAGGFNRQFYRTIAVPVERYLLAMRGHYDVTEDIRLFTEATYAKTSSNRQIEPFGLSSEDIFPASGGLVPIATNVNGTLVTNPLVPGPIAAAAEDEDGDGIPDISFARRLGEFGTRSGSTTRDFFRITTGFEGGFLDDRFRWDVAYVFGQTTESQRSSGQVNVLNFANALAAVPDLDDVNNNGSTTDVICASATARAQGCVPINIFGAGSITPAAVQYIQAPQSYQTNIKQHVLTANLSGDLFELPAGPLGFAIGAEYRRESSVENNDALTNAGLNGGNAIPDTSGKFNVKEVYGELRVPILSDTPFFQELSAGVSGRISDYSTVGTVYTYSGNVEWAPVSDVRFRATYSRSVRAPNIGELFTGPSQTFPAGLQDPCEDVGPTGGGTLGDVCRSFPGVLANIAANGGAFTITQSDLQGVSGFNSGNPDLNEEKSTSYTIGAVISPRSIEWLRNFALTVDYFNIDVKDAIQAPPRQFILDQCFRLGNPEFCSLVTRRPTATAVNSAGSLDLVNAPQVNSGRLKTDGIDVVGSYRYPITAFGVDGNLNARVSYTHYFSGYTVPTPGADKDPYVGEIGNPKDRFTATLAYGGGIVDVSFTGNWIGPVKEDNQFLAAFDLPPNAIRIGAEFYLDSQIRVHPTDNFEVYFGVDNLLDNDAPKILSGSFFNTTGTDTAADVYDVFGRRFYTGVRIRF